MNISANNIFLGAYNARILNKAHKGNFNNKANLTNKLEDLINSINVKNANDGVTLNLSKETKEILKSIEAREKMLQDTKEFYDKCSNVQNQDIKDIFSSKANDQWLVFSEYLYNNGFYDKVSDEEVKNIESLIMKITDGLDSLCQTGIDLFSNVSEQLDSKEANLELESSTAALKHFNDKFVTDNLKDGFSKLINSYYLHNTKMLKGYQSIEEKFDEARSKLSDEMKYRLEVERLKHPNKDKDAAKEILIRDILGKITHTEEDIKRNNSLYSNLFNQLGRTGVNEKDILFKIKNIFMSFYTNGIEDKSVFEFIEKRSEITFDRIEGYWNDLIVKKQINHNYP